MGLSFWHLLLIVIVVFVVFGAGRLPQVMGDLGRGMRSLRDGLKGEDAPKIENKKDKDETPPS